MKALKATMTIAAVGIALSGRAHAATLFTSGAYSSNETIYCDVANVRTNKSVTVSIEAYNNGGALISSTPSPVTLTPGQGTSISSAAIGADYCKFIVVGSKLNVRAMAVFRNQNTSEYTVAVPAL